MYPFFKILIFENVNKNKAKNIKGLQEAAKYFLKNCYNAGISESVHWMERIFPGASA